MVGGPAFSDWVDLATLLVAGAAVWVAFAQLPKLARQVELQTQQMTLQTFSDYTKRYQEIVLNLPEDVNDPAFKLTPARDDYQKTMRYMRAYFDLSYEEWYLQGRSLIDPNFWNVWRGGIETALSKAAFQQAWAVIRNDSNFGPDFDAFVSGSMAAGNSLQAVRLSS